MADSFSLVVFVANNQVARSVEIPRCSPDFGTSVLARMITKSEATFRVDSSNGCATLVPSSVGAVGSVMRSNNAFERPGGYRGRAVLAMNCVLGGAEWALCPAAQLGR